MNFDDTLDEAPNFFQQSTISGLANGKHEMFLFHSRDMTRPQFTIRAFILAVVVLLVLYCNSGVYRPLRAPNGTRSQPVAFPNSQTTPLGSYAIAAGELPGYTGWGRPEFTLAGYFTAATPKGDTISAGDPYIIELQCRGHADCQTPSYFYVRAYGPAILTGRIEARGKGGYRALLYPVDPGVYTVEIVITISNPPPFDVFPLASKAAPILYEGYLLQDFPTTLTVLPNKMDHFTKLPVCNAADLLNDRSVYPHERARWKVVDQIRSKHHQSNTGDGTQVTFPAYQQSYNSLGVVADYQFHNCRLLVIPYRGENVTFNPFLCLQEPTHFILIGDSTMRIQHQIFQQYLSLPEMKHHSLTFIELYGGILRCNTYGPILEQELKVELERNSKSQAHRAVLFNTGLHDIHRLCGTEWEKDRRTYLTDPQLPCVEQYRRGLADLIHVVGTLPAAVKLFQTTTAGWPKYGNFGINWDPRYGQGLPLDASFVEYFNTIATTLLESHPYIGVVDGYWISLARPDNREIGPRAAIGPKLSHPGIEVVHAMVRIWSMVVLRNLCG